MLSMFVQPQHVIEFVESRGYRLDAEGSQFTFSHPYRAGIIQVDVSSDKIALSLLREDWEKDKCEGLVDELIAWLEQRPVIY